MEELCASQPATGTITYWEYQMNKKHSFVIVGLTGLSISFVLNIFNQYVLGVGGEAWWLMWFPGYVVWFVFLVIGIGLSKRTEENHDQP